MLTKHHESAYTRAVSDLINLIEHPKSNYNSLIQDAQNYYAVAESQKNSLNALIVKRDELKKALSDAPSSKKNSASSALSSVEKRIKDEEKVQQSERLLRLDRALQVCLSILDLSEGEDHDDTLLKSAKFLGTVLLLSPREGRKSPQLHQRLKPAYKAVLSLRLLDKLMLEGLIDNRYIMSNYMAEQRFDREQKEGALPPPYLTNIMLPIMFVALFQDIGMQHPDAQQILTGEDGLADPFRLLPVDERKRMLKLNYEQTLDYLEHGLGCQQYLGNSKEQRDDFEKDQRRALNFSRALLRDTIQPRLAIGDIIKIPQIYCSVVLSTKRDCKSEDLPKACLLINQLAEKGGIKKRTAELFTAMMGHFPQGYGVTYIPVSDQGDELDRYEYAIVNGLCPDDPYEPSCRLVTRNLTYISSGVTATIKKGTNLHFPQVRKKLAKIDKARLEEILRSLMHEFDPEKAESLVPAYWLPYEYFSEKRNQNLWSKAF